MNPSALHRRLLSAFAALAVGIAPAPAQDDAEAIARAKRPERLRDLDVSGKALKLVAERIDPSLPLGSCANPDTGARIRVILPNVRSHRGQVRVSLFGSDPSQWVRSKGGKLVRFDVTATHGRMEVCMPLPYGPGEYAVALYHDENGDSRYSLTGEGYGFSNNARSGLFGPPSHSQAVFEAGPAQTDVEIRLRY